MITHHQEVVRIALLAGDEGVIRDHTFDGCDIKGPAVLVSLNSVIEHNRIDGPAEAVLWEVPDDRVGFIGGVVVENCRFTGCHFINVGFAGPRAFIEKFGT